MNLQATERIQSAEVVLPCADLLATQRFFMDELGFRLDAVFPADDPTVAVLSGHGLRLRLQRGSDGPPVTLRLACAGTWTRGDAGRELTAPNGTRLELVEATAELSLPPLQPALVVTRGGGGSTWTAGRADMSYRDLIRCRLGGRFIASHIRISEGGPVSDWVHHHRVCFQMIYCYRGRVRVVYEDQGAPFDLEAGDCVLQPPGIRHRVLDCSDGLEVVEISCPAAHETLADHELALPTAALRPDRDFSGQTFVRHRASTAAWTPGHRAGFETRDLGLSRATAGRADARVHRPGGRGLGCETAPAGELNFFFVLDGSLTLRCDGREREEEPLTAGDCWTIPAGLAAEFSDCSDDLQLLEVHVTAGRSPHGP